MPVNYHMFLDCCKIYLSCGISTTTYSEMYSHHYLTHSCVWQLLFHHTSQPSWVWWLDGVSTIWVGCEVVLGGECARARQCALWEINVVSLCKKGVPMGGQESGVKITFLGADPRPMLRLDLESPRPKPNGPQMHTHVHETSARAGIRISCVTGSERALSLKAEVLHHVSSCLLIYLTRLHPTIDVTFTKQPNTKPNN